MTKRPMLQVFKTGATDDVAEPNRTQQIAAIVDHCTTAKALAEDAGNKFLAYMLAMTIQEARSALRTDSEDAVVRPMIDSTSR